MSGSSIGLGQHSHALESLLGCSKASAPEKELRVHQEVEVTGSQTWPREGVSAFLGNRGFWGWRSLSKQVSPGIQQNYCSPLWLRTSCPYSALTLGASTTLKENQQIDQLFREKETKPQGSELSISTQLYPKGLTLIFSSQNVSLVNVGT